jgi:hypothetical protein
MGNYSFKVDHKPKTGTLLNDLSVYDFGEGVEQMRPNCRISLVSLSLNSLRIMLRFLGLAPH